MLSKKYFEKRLFYYEKFSDIDFCLDRCEDWDEFDCNIESPRLCEIYRKAKRKHSVCIKHVEFNFETLNEEKVIMDCDRIILILIGKNDNSKLSKQLKNIEYKTIKFYDLGYIIDKKEFYFGVNRYSRIFVYFALKCLKNPEILISNFDQEYPLIVRNDKCTIYIAPRANEY